MPNVTLGPYNTVTVAAASGVYRLLGVGPLDVLNLGPGTVYIRADLDPTVADAKSLALPANWSLGRIISAGNGVGVIAAADTTISVRLVI